MTISRRSLITGLATFVAAPALVKASSLMPIKPWADEGVALWSTSHPIGMPFPGDIFWNGRHSVRIGKKTVDWVDTHWGQQDRWRILTNMAQDFAESDLGMRKLAAMEWGRDYTIGYEITP